MNNFFIRSHETGILFYERIGNKADCFAKAEYEGNWKIYTFHQPLDVKAITYISKVLGDDWMSLDWLRCEGTE